MENDAIGTIEMVEVTSTNGQLTVTRLRIKEEDVISSTTIDGSSKKSPEAENEEQKTQEHLSKKLPLQPDTGDNGTDLSKTTTSDKDISSSNSISINVEDASATSFNMSSDSINTFASKMQHLNLKKGDDNLNEVDPKFNEANQGPKVVEVIMNADENDSDQGKKTDNGSKNQESYRHFIQSISPPSKLTSSSPV